MSPVEAYMDGYGPKNSFSELMDLSDTPYKFMDHLCILLFVKIEGRV
jgi:hypothetical protein